MLMQHSGMSAKGEPRNVVNGLIPRPLLREYTQEGRVHRVLQGAVPDVAYTDPGHGREMIQPHVTDDGGEGEEEEEEQERG